MNGFERFFNWGGCELLRYNGCEWNLVTTQDDMFFFFLSSPVCPQKKMPQAQAPPFFFEKKLDSCHIKGFLRGIISGPFAMVQKTWTFDVAGFQTSYQSKKQGFSKWKAALFHFGDSKNSTNKIQTKTLLVLFLVILVEKRRGFKRHFSWLMDPTSCRFWLWTLGFHGGEE